MMNTMTAKERIVGKATSGRFVCTVVVVLVYAVCAIKGVIKPEGIREITLLVLYAYFTRNREAEKIVDTEDNRN